MDDEEEAIDTSGSPFAPASDYLGKRLVISEANLHLPPSPSPNKNAGSVNEIINLPRTSKTANSSGYISSDSYK